VDKKEVELNNKDFKQTKDRWGEPLNEEKAPLTMDAAVKYIVEHKSEMTESYSESLKEVITPLTMDIAVQYIVEHESEMTESYSETLYKEIKVFVLERLVKMYELQ
jgi:hypothetical protein